MRKYLAATVLIAIAIGPAHALGLNATVGPVGVGAEVGVDKNGVSAGVGAGVKGVGGAKAGTSLNRSGGASLGVGGNLGNKSGGLSVGAGSNAGSSSGAGTAPASGAVSGGSAAGPGSGSASGPGSGTRTSSGGLTAGASSGGGRIISIAPTKNARTSIVLPRILWPLKKKSAHERGEWGYPIRLPLTIAAVPGTPKSVVRACQKAIASAASPLGGVRVRAASAGSLLRHRSGALTAPLVVSIDYAGENSIQVRQARIRCRLDSAGKVVAVN
ncbi:MULTISPECIES: helicase [Sinorhizobium]|uniref:Helicase n=2 Tax=Sinorhizobium TaxID=28105 RepID=A0A2S3YTL5_9HYPH|nr:MULTISPECIES: helicase [Sinorhizobium]AUX80558.1 hypothetical protein NXT3_PC01406 [Sinorhizobium fredii]PDT37538.1 helicase [Sinorhizobium sp. FG01]POH34953.1 helicase [Sinorhizobium americanum]